MEGWSADNLYTQSVYILTNHTIYGATIIRDKKVKKHVLDTDPFKFGNCRRLNQTNLYQVQYSVDVDKQSSHMFRDAGQCGTA